MNDSPDYKYKIASVEKTFKLIELLAERKKEMSMVEIEKEINMQPGTIHRFLNTLKYLGYVIQNSKTKKYYLSFKFIKTANQIIHKDGFIEGMYPYISLILVKYGVPVNLSVFTNDDAIVIASYGKDIIAQPKTEFGAAIPLYNSAAGKNFLAALPPEILEKKLDELVLIPTSTYTITNKDSLKKEIELTKKRGYSTSIDEFISGYTILGIPINNRDSSIIASINMVIDSGRKHILLNEDAIEDIKKILNNISINF